MCLSHSGRSAIKPRLAESGIDGCPSESFSYLHTGTLELSQELWSDYRALGPGVLVVPNAFHLRIMEGTMLLGTLQCNRIVLCLSKSCPIN